MKLHGLAVDARATPRLADGRPIEDDDPSLYPAAPYTGYASPIEEERHRHLLEHASRSLEAQAFAAETIEPTGKRADAILKAARERRV